MSEAAQRLGVTRAAIPAAIQSKRLKAKRGTFQVERVIRRTLTGWVIEEADLKNMRSTKPARTQVKKIDLV